MDTAPLVILAGFCSFCCFLLFGSSNREMRKANQRLQRQVNECIEGWNETIEALEKTTANLIETTEALERANKNHRSLLDLVDKNTQSAPKQDAC